MEKGGDLVSSSTSVHYLNPFPFAASSVTAEGTSGPRWNQVIWSPVATKPWSRILPGLPRPDRWGVHARQQARQRSEL